MTPAQKISQQIERFKPFRRNLQQKRRVVHFARFQIQIIPAEFSFQLSEMMFAILVFINRFKIFQIVSFQIILRRFFCNR